MREIGNVSPLVRRLVRNIKRSYLKRFFCGNIFSSCFINRFCFMVVTLTSNAISTFHLINLKQLLNRDILEEILLDFELLLLPV